MSGLPPPPRVQPPEEVDRRAALGTLLRGTCALAALCTGCGGAWPEAVVLDVPAPDAGTDSGTPGPTCAPITPGSPEEGWVEVPLADHPALREPGGQSVVRVPQALLDVVVMHPSPGCYTAVWRICTHGDCAVTWEAGARWLECPCHGSRFGEDGQVLRGPATRPLAAFPAVRVGDSLFIHRPR